MLKTLKQVTLHLLKNAGAFHVLEHSQWRRERLLILCYHGVSIEDEHEWNDNLFLSPSDFAARMELLKTGAYNVLSLTEGVSRLYAKALPPRSVVITVDDGMYNFSRRAHPILKNHGFPATVYLTTYYCENNRPIFRLICSYMLWKRRGRVIESGGLAGLRGRMDLRTQSSRERIVAVMDNFAREERLSSRQKNDLAAQLAESLDIDYGKIVRKRILHLMTPEEVRELARQGIDFQMHTHRHCAPVEADSFCREILDNSSRIEKLTGSSPVHFCYPGGMHQPSFLPWLREHLIASGTTCEPGIASMDSDPLLLPRLVDHSRLTPLEYKSWLSGVGSLMPHRSWRVLLDV